ncbi:MAG: nucleoside kinase [Oscillospiraceae bacterium]|nr:nucleoside kinase [Oscillospiraceae bacterium]
MKYYNVSINGAPPAEVAERTALFDLIGPDERRANTVVAAFVNNRIAELTEEVAEDCSVRFVGILSSEGRRIYERSLIIMLVKAVKELYPNRRIIIEHSVRFDIYFELLGDRETLPEEIAAIEKRMRELAARDIPFKRVEIPLDEAEKLFKEKERQDLYNSIRESYRPYVIFCEFDGMFDCSYGYLAPHSGYLKEFSLQYRYPGAIMAMPQGRAEKSRAAKHYMYQDVPKLLNVFAEYKNWGRILGIENIGELNRAVRTGDVPDIVRVAEALQEKKISQIADQITNTTEHKKIVLIAGPSSSGKTTFANRLSIQLRVNGFMTKVISMDNYFLNRDVIPLDEDGDPNLECPEALDVELFSSQMKALITGNTVNVPIYNFKKGVRDDRTQPLRVGDNEILMVEGIHGLNPKVTASIPKESKHRVYISALTSLNIDDHNRISTTDTRLIRRIVRDNAFRGTKAAETIKMWPSVRAGEEEYIFPYQESCDSMFNSGLIYELGAMKGVAQDLLCEIADDVPEYTEAIRLHRFLSYFAQILTDDIPTNSILREFIGGSCFHV